MHEISIKYPATIDEDELCDSFYQLLGFLRHSGRAQW